MSADKVQYFRMAETLEGIALALLQMHLDSLGLQTSKILEDKTALIQLYHQILRELTNPSETF